MSGNLGNVAGLLALAVGVQNYLSAQGSIAQVAFGQRARSEQLNQAPGGAGRLVFMAGRVPPDTDAPKSINAGEIHQPRMPRSANGNPRALREFRHIVSLEVWGVAAKGYQGGLGLGDEADQYAATLDLFELAVQAIQGAQWQDPAGEVHSVGLADVVFESADWVKPPIEMAFGHALLVTFTHRGPIFDAPQPIAKPSPAVNRGTLTS